MKKAAAEASMQRSKKARMVALFVVLDHVMCLFSAWRRSYGWSHRASVARNVMQKVSYVHVRITLRRRPRTNARSEGH